jgi:hypothetical protein
MIGASSDAAAALAVLAVLEVHAQCGVCIAERVGITFAAFCSTVIPLCIASRVTEGPAGFFRLTHPPDVADVGSCCTSPVFHARPPPTKMAA